MHDTQEDSKRTASRQSFLVAVAGNPNCGKTTLFNALTGLRHKVGNYPGVTVEKREGRLAGHETVRLLDLPGTYSLSARSPDEEIAREVLIGHAANTPRPDAVLVVIDANNLERNLYLASQIIELGLPTVIACNMMDLLEQAGHKLDLEQLSKQLGVPVIRTVGHRGEGVQALRAAITTTCDSPPVRLQRRRWSLSAEMEKEIRQLASAMEATGYADPKASDAVAILLLTEAERPQNNSIPAAALEALRTANERLAQLPESDFALEVTTSRYGWLGEIADACLRRAQSSGATTTDQIDRVLTHRWAGPAIFTVIMLGLFYSIFSLADPLMGQIETALEAGQRFLIAHMPPGTLRDLLVEGVMAGVGNVLVFFPQICLLFMFITLLEDTGYMARAAFLMDRIMNRVGLHGRSFIPLLSCHACAIPGIMATRTIENPKDRLATILVAPLMSCSARLPVYTVLIAAALPLSSTTKALTLFAMYALGVATALLAATVFKKTLLKGPAPTFIMELPPYRIPRWQAVLRVMWDRSRLFLTRAGTAILAVTVLLWLLMSYPVNQDQAAEYDTRRAELTQTAPSDLAEQLAAIDRAEAAENLQNSFAGRIGRTIEPALRPLGYDWKIGIGIIASFAAREVFVSTMGIVYSVGETDPGETPLQEKMRNATWPGPEKRLVFTPPVAVGLMVFYVLSCQCVSTLIVIRRETNSWGWPAFVFAYMTALAYVGALLVYQIGSAIS